MTRSRSDDLESRLAEDLSPEQRQVYARCLRRGCAPRLALMLASRRGPEMLNSDRIFNETQRRRMGEISPVNMDAILEIAHKAGISTHGKYYTGMGRYDDPAAWCSTVDDVLDVARERNLDLDGPVVHRGRRVEQAPPERLAADIRRELALERVVAEYHEKGAALPTGKSLERAIREAEEAVEETHGAGRLVSIPKPDDIERL